MSVEEAIEVIFQETSEDEEKRKVLLLRGDPNMHKLIAAWPLVSIERQEWDESDVWKGCVFSFSDWCDLAGLPDMVYNVRKCELIIRMGLVLPDGRIHFWVADYLDKEAERMLMGDWEAKARASQASRGR